MNRRVIQVVLFLLLGAIVNVAVAWTIAWFNSGNDEISNVSTSHPYQRNGLWWITMKGVGNATTSFASRPFASHGRAKEYVDFFDGRLSSNEIDLPSWVRHPHIEDTDPYGNVLAGPILIDVGRGWPWLALMHGLDSVIDGDSLLAPNDVVFGIQAGNYARPVTGIPRILPLRPIWPGFAINTIFYAAILWATLAFPFVLRRRRRIKRGLCPACAYDLRATNDVCTECGATVVRQQAMGKKPLEST